MYLTAATFCLSRGLVEAISPVDTHKSDYREIYVVIDMSKFTPVKFRQLWVDVENIPEKYADTVVCVTNGPLMTQPETSDMKANITLIVKQNDFTNEQLEQMAKELSYRVKWGLAMGVDGYVHI